MKRSIYKDLLRWKESPDRKPLVLEGARQVGKTWILKEFGSNEYKNVAYVNCDNNPLLEELFIDFDIDRIIRALSAITEISISENDTLIAIDEIQELPKGLTALKYFAESERKYHVAVAGSLLGLQIHEGTGFPVGKVDELYIHPMSFEEFLMALKQDILLNQINEHDWLETIPLHEKLVELLRQYYYTGGMPEVVKCYVETGDLSKVRSLQNAILNGYMRDISKHAPKEEVNRIHAVWESLPSQLAKENKKFIYGALKKGARAKEYEKAIQWLIDSGLIMKVNKVNQTTLPLKFYEDYSTFKLFALDLGLLGAMSDVPAKEILVGSNIFCEYKGAFTEQFVAQQLYFENHKLFYYTNENSTLEIDFVLQKEDVYLLEVKAEVNVHSKRLKTVLDKNINLKGIRFSMLTYRIQERIENIPLYLCNTWGQKLKFLQKIM